MRWLRRVISGAIALVRSERVEGELDEELRAYLETAVDEKMRVGLSRDEATRMARLETGLVSFDSVKDCVRDVGWEVGMERLWQDLRFACRMLAKNRGFSTIAILVLGLGIGVNSTLFTIVNAICIRGLPIESPDRVVFMASTDARARDRGLSFGEFQDVRTGTTALDGVAAYTTTSVALGDDRQAPARFNGVFISANAFDVIRERPILGRGFTTDDDRPGAAAVVMLGYGVWQTRFAGARDIVGQTLRTNGVPAIVIGVMPEGFKFPFNADLWQPLQQLPGIVGGPRDARTISVFGRLRDGASLVQARGEGEAIAADLAGKYPQTNAGVRFTTVPINERFNGRITDPNWVAFIAVGILTLLIACANVANLLLARAVHRWPEIAIRTSLGGSRWRIVRQLLAESAVLGVAGAALGFLLSLTATRIFVASQPENFMPYFVRFTMDVRVFAVLAASVVVSVLAFGLIPALHTSRKNLAFALKEGGRSGMPGSSARRWTAAFLTVEFALTLVLLCYVGLTARNSRAMDRADVVISPDNLLTMWMALPPQKYRTPDDRVAFQESVRERFAAIPGASSVTIASALPFAGAVARQLVIQGAEDVQPLPTVWTVAIDHAYFETLRLPIAQGRAFTELDGMPGRESVIVNARFASMYFPNQDPVGRRIRVLADGQKEAPWASIAGVSPTVRQRQLVEPDAVVYLPQRAAAPPISAIIVRGVSDVASLTSAAREQLRTLDADLPLYRVMPMHQVINDSRFAFRLSGVMITVIAVVALIMASIGIYAVTSHAVSQRTREIGVRMSLGAQPQQIRWLVLRRVFVQLAIGLAVGIACTLAWERAFLNPEQPDRHLAQPDIVLAVAALLTTVAAVGCLWPARRAMRVDPVVALRYD